MLLNLPSQTIMISTIGRRKPTSTTVHIMALDGMVNVNSLFTLALFLGLAVNPSDPTTYTLILSPSCLPASSSVAKNLVASHVYSFSSFLFSSLIACGLKQAIRSAKDGDSMVEVGADDTIAHVNLRVLRAGILASAIGSVSGCVFLMLALVDLVQIKLGVLLACGSLYSLAAVGPLVILVPSALVIYVFIVLHAFTR